MVYITHTDSSCCQVALKSLNDMVFFNDRSCFPTENASICHWADLGAYKESLNIDRNADTFCVVYFGLTLNITCLVMNKILKIEHNTHGMYHKPYSRQVTEWMKCDVVIHPPPTVYPKAGNRALGHQWAIQYHCQNDISAIAFAVCDLVHWKLWPVSNVLLMQVNIGQIHSFVFCILPGHTVI